MTISFWKRASEGKHAGDNFHISCRISIGNKRSEISTGISVKGEDWDQDKKKVKKSEPLHTSYNQQLLMMEAQLFEIHQEQLRRGKTVTPALISKIYRKGTEEPLKMIDAYDQLIEYKINIEQLRKSTLKKYYTFRRVLVRYLEEQEYPSMLALEVVPAHGLRIFTWYAKQSTHESLFNSKLFVRSISAALRLAAQNGHIPFNPLSDLRFPTVKGKKTVDALSKEELKLIEDYHPKTEDIRRVRDLFLFQCYTGLSYEALARFEYDEHVHLEEGIEYIIMTRAKTERDFVVPLFHPAKTILLRWGKRLPPASNRPSKHKIYHNTNYNRKLKELAIDCSIEPQRMTTHMGRRTFATRMLNDKGVSLEVVAEMLGHADTRITQSHYAKVTIERLKFELEKMLEEQKRDR
ncbi:site-specific integrase [Limibacter armeniacum]|uniref:site-specific integrase n=1 Tax=Limibacter armeniacum TaxID=466084 RepID=UPI002FE5EE7F